MNAFLTKKIKSRPDPKPDRAKEAFILCYRFGFMEGSRTSLRQHGSRQELFKKTFSSDHLWIPLDMEKHFEGVL